MVNTPKQSVSIATLFKSTTGLSACVYSEGSKAMAATELIEDTEVSLNYLLGYNNNNTFFFSCSLSPNLPYCSRCVQLMKYNM